MDSPSNTTSYRPRRAALNWVDLLVIAATVLTFGAVVASTSPRSKAFADTTTPTSTLPTPKEQLSSQPGLIKARIRLATGGPWS